ncbi:WEB family protein At3g02930, chloroplastic-like isoform X2 [Macadamia integrifolia]|uniref:WEB family protein At3g02930, chloroplastic-like isoform X2 n=1 Tax=Macadamia integrifolia TaxID=60698 RepID=UPI001C4F83F2|nr:WEB family protein At3g02930, chloroplastic-like isoform X2 [Macadamia integrifolia]
MNSSKSKSSIPEASQSKTLTATPRVSKVTRVVAKSDADSPKPLQNSRVSIDRSPRSADSKPLQNSRLSIDRSPRSADPKPAMQNSRLSIDRSPRSADPKPAIDRRSPKPKIATPPDEDLRKSKERLASAEKDKAQVLAELREAKRLAEEANEKLSEALVAKKRAEENSEIEKFRAVELEQAGIEAAQRQDGEWQKELEAVRSQHAVDVAALLSATQDLQRVKQELAMASDAKNQALSHADDAAKIAEIHAKKVELLSAEVIRLKAMFDSKSEREANESTELIKILNSEVDSLKQELAKAKSIEQKLLETEALVEQFRIEVEAAKKAELTASNLVEEWRKKVREFESRVEEANQMERSATESLDLLMKQLEGKSNLLQDSESEIASLKEKVDSMEISIGQQRKDFEESEHRLETAKQEASEMVRMVEFMKAELETVTEEKMQALNNEQLAASSVQDLLAEKNKLINELETSRGEEEKSKKALESLASALQEVSADAREAKEKFLSSKDELENAKTQIEELKFVVHTTNEKYETMLEESKQEIDLLTKALDYSNHEVKNSKAEWERKELNLGSSIKKSEEETYVAKREIDRLVHLLKKAEDEAQSSKEEGARILSTLKQTESEVNSLKAVVEEAKAENVRLRERLLDKENELQSISEENEELRTRETVALAKVEELSKLLAEASAKNIPVENGELSDSEKDYDLLPKVVEFSAENGNGGKEDKHMFEFPYQHVEEPQEDKDQEKESVVPVELKVENGNGNPNEGNGIPQEEEKKKEQDDDSVEVEGKMWENCKIGEKDLPPEKEPGQESFEDDLDSKADGENFDQVNGLPPSDSFNNSGSFPSKEQQIKKKKPLLKKFGSLLKKRATSGNK